MDRRVYSWAVERVVDGDTIEVRVSDDVNLPEILRIMSVRVSGIDTPEKGDKAKCDLERTRADAAHVFTLSMIANARIDNVPIAFTNIKRDKYGGRMVATVWIGRKNLADMLKENGHARPYKGRGEKGSWCSVWVQK